MTTFLHDITLGTYVPNFAFLLGDGYNVFIVFIGNFSRHMQYFITEWSPYSFINIMAILLNS